MKKFTMKNVAKFSLLWVLSIFMMAHAEMQAQCDVPTGLTVPAIENNQATVSWGAATGAVSYTINYRVVGENQWLVANTSSTSAVLNCLFSGTNYEWKVKSDCASESSPFSNLSTFTTTGTAPPNPPDCESPINTSTSGIGDNGATFTWDAVTEALEYNVLHRIVGTQAWTSNYTSSTSIAVTGLFSGNNYEWKVRSVCNAERTLFSLFTPVELFSTTGPPTNPPTCDFPLNLVSSSIGDNTATISWDAVTGADDYRLLYRRVGVLTWTQMTTTNTSENLTGLNSGTTYEWKVRTNCSNGATSLNAPTRTFQTTGTFVCTIPGNLKAINITETCADLIWDDVGNVDSYNVNYRPTGTTQWMSALPTTNSLSLTNLVPGTTYDWKVRSVCSSGNSLFSAVHNFVTIGDPVPIPMCEPPATTSETNIMDTEVTLNWGTVSNADSYEVLHRPDGASSWTTSVVTAPTTSLTLTGLTSGTDYEWKVRVDCDNDLTSIFTTIDTFTTTGSSGDPPICNFPSGLTSSGITDTEATLSWNAEANALSYTVVYRVSGGTSWTSVSVTAPSTSTNLTGLVTGTDYQWKVKTICDNELISSFSSLRFFTTTGAPGDPDLCNYPSDRMATNIATTTATLSWTAEVNALSYEVVYRAVGDLFWTTRLPSSNSVDITGLLAGTSYEWKVKTRCDGKNSLFSPKGFFDTQASSSAGNEAFSTTSKGIASSVTASPNPFISNTAIRFRVTEDTYASIKIYDFTGQQIAEVYAGMAKAGQVHEVDLDGSALPKGIYIYRLQVRGGETHTNKLILQK